MGPCMHRNKANDLKEQLTWWARPPEADWPTREQRLEWLEHALGEAQDIMRAMQSNGALDADIGTYVEIVRVSSEQACICLWQTFASEGDESSRHTWIDGNRPQ